MFGFKVLVVFRTKYLDHISKYWVHFLFANSGITRLPWDQNYLMDLRIEDDFQFLCFFFHEIERMTSSKLLKFQIRNLKSLTPITDDELLTALILHNLFPPCLYICLMLQESLHALSFRVARS